MAYNPTGKIDIMRNQSPGDKGIKRLIDHYRQSFRIPENLYYYDDKHYKEAEKKFIKYALKFGLTD